MSFGGLDYFRGTGRWGAVERLVESAGRIRGYGDFWAHCLVASGSTEVAIESAVSTWDLVAVRALVAAAGGRSTSLTGEETAAGGDSLSTNGLLHDVVLELVHRGV